MRRGLVWMVLVWLVGGCMKPLDFSQVKEIEAEPVWTVDLFYTQLTAQDFYENNRPLPAIDDTLPFEIFNNNIVRNGLQKMIVYLKVTNPFVSSFKFEMEFLDGHNERRFIAQRIIRAAQDNTPTQQNFIIVINKRNHPDIVLTKKLHFRLIRLDTTDIRSQSGQLIIQSKGDFFMKID